DRRSARVLRRTGGNDHQARRAPARAARRASGPSDSPRAGRILRPDAEEAPVGRPDRSGAALVLTELRVRDLAVIADVSLSLAEGLNVLTGETGAGKS